MEYSESQVVNITQSSPGVPDRNWVTDTHISYAVIWLQSARVFWQLCEWVRAKMLMNYFYCSANNIVTFSNSRRRTHPQLICNLIWISHSLTQAFTVIGHGGATALLHIV